MMLNKAPVCKGIQARQRGRSAAIVRCTAPVAEPPASITQPDAAAPSTSSASAQSRGFRRALGRPQSSDPRVPGQSRPQSQSQSQSRAPTESDQQRPRLPSFTFLEDDAERIALKAEAVFRNHFSLGKGVIVRCLGRQGAAGALRFILALRDECAAASNQIDVSIRMWQQEPIQYFGTPLMLFVNPRRDREELPEETGPRCTALIVSGRTDPSKLGKRVVAGLTNLQAGSFLRFDMVGAEALFRGLTALQEAQSEVPSFSSNYYLVPELVSVRVREKQPREGGQEDAEASLADAPQAPAPQGQQPQQQGQGQEPQAAGASAEADEGLRVQVVRLYVGRSGGRTAAAAAGAPAGSAALAVGPPNSDGKVLVSEAELQELKGALGTMMEQQKRLTEMLNQRAAAAAAAAPAAPEAQARA